MEFDSTTQEFVFDFKDQTAMGHPHIPLDERVPIGQLEELLTRAQERLSLNFTSDFSEFPAGPRKNHLVAQRMKNSDVLKRILFGLSGHAETSVVSGVEEFLRSHGS